MLIELSIENFRSVKDREELSLIPFKKYKEHPGNIFDNGKNTDALKTSVVYGANASGKSNVLKALKAIEFLVLHSGNFQPDDDIPPYEPYRLDKKNVTAPVKFEMDFIAGDELQYTYKLSFTRKEILSEKLHFYPKTKEALLFERKKGTSVKYGEYYRGGKKSIEKQLLKNQLFLSKAANNNVEQLKNVFLFFKEKLHVIPFLYGRNDHELRQLYAERLAGEKNSEFNVISALDTGINRLSVDETDPDSFRFPENFPDEVKKEILNDFKYNIKAEHVKYDDEKAIEKEYFDIRDESVGTQRLFVIAGLVLDALEDGTLLVIDEFEKSLHPHIMKFLIKLFHNPEMNPNKAQLLIATHDVSQLDNELFRRDQIWFTQKDKYGATSLYSLADHNGVRQDIPFDKWYYSGRFEGTPVIDELKFKLEYEEKKKAKKNQKI
ncbi:MAG: ATP/GTP-binding protein [Flavobacteriales bacterium]